MQGVEDDLLKKNDFVLSIQTIFQFEVLKVFGNIIVCIDSTHQTNHYNCPLNTYGTWHKVLMEKSKEPIKDPSVYHHLLILFSESNNTEFNKKLQTFLSWLNQEKYDKNFYHIFK